MSPATEQILQAALALPDDERTKLIDALLETPADDAAPSLSPEWLAEIRRRSAEIDAGTVEPIPWPVVRDEARRRIEEWRRG